MENRIKYLLYDKKAVLSQRWPCNAHYIWVPWKFSGLPDYAHGYFSLNFMGFCSDDTVRKSVVCGHMLTEEMLTGQMLIGLLLTGQMLTPLSKNRANAHKCVFVWFDYGTANFFLGFLPPPSPALLTYTGHLLCPSRGFQRFLCTMTSVGLLIYS